MNGREETGVENPIAEIVATPTAIEIQLDSQKSVSRIHSINQVIDGAVKVSLQRTNPRDWVKMGDRFYLQATGAQKLRAVFGLYYRDRRATREVNPDGSYSYIVTGTIGSKLLDGLYGEVTLEIEGGRSSNDPFFAKGNRTPDPLDVRKASLANWEVRAVTALLGLGNLTAEDLTKNGVNTSQIIGVEYQKGAEGGGNGTVISEAQAKRLWAIAREHKVAEETLKDLLTRSGFDSTYKVTRDRYDELVSIVQGGPAKVAKTIVELAGFKTERQPGEDD